MKVKLDSIHCTLNFYDNEWKNSEAWKVDEYMYERLCKILLNKTQYLKNIETDYWGPVSNYRFKEAKEQFEIYLKTK